MKTDSPKQPVTLSPSTLTYLTDCGDFILPEDLLEALVKDGGIEKNKILMTKAPEKVPNNLVFVQFTSPETQITYQGLAVKKPWM